MLIPGTILLGRYEIIRLLGKGGMGAVHQAYDKKLNCPAAVKENFVATGDLRQYFKREAELLANLRHRALPKVTDYFFQKNEQFLVMEFIPGENLEEALENRQDRPFALDDVLQWADDLLDVLDYLHRRVSPAKPIIHGDIKPANLKLTPDGSIILLDFGLSKGKAGNMSSTGNTSQVVIGYTARYAPLEQILKANQQLFDSLSTHHSDQAERARNDRFAPQSDLYSLGVTLHHLLTGRKPDPATKRATLVWAGMPDPITPAREINTQIPAAVSEILARAMSLNYEDRFASALEMRKALREAHSPQTRSSEQRKPTLPPTEPSPSDISTIITPATVPMSIRVKYGILGKCGNSVRSVAFSPDGRSIASGGNDNIVRLWDTETGEMQVLGQCGNGMSGFSYVSAVAFSPDGRSIASASSDRTVRLWNARTGRAKILARYNHPIHSVAFASDGQHLASGSSDGTVHVWDVANGQGTIIGRCGDAVWSVAFSPDGTSIASENCNRMIVIWSVPSGEKRILDAQSGDACSVSFSPDGGFIASGGWDHNIRIWNLRTDELRILGRCDDVVRAIAFSPDGQRIASASDDNLIRLWDTQKGEMSVLGACDDVASAVAFSPDGKSIASGSWDRTVRLWQVV